MLIEFVDRFHHRQRFLPRSHRRDALAHPDGVGQLGLVELFESRFVIEQLHLRRSARREEVNHPLGLGREVRRTERSFGLLGLVGQRGE